MAANVDPEEAFVAALASCHMLFFLAIAAKLRFVVDEYVDEPVGTLAKNDRGELAMTRVELRPRIAFGGERQPAAEELDEMHRESHRRCFIANSVTTEVAVRSVG